MLGEVRLKINLKGPEVGSYTASLDDGDNGQTEYVQNGVANSGKFLGHINQLQALFVGDQLLIGAIFISTGARI